MTWEDPPPRDKADWDAIGRELMTRPGAFKVVGVYATANSAAVSAYQIRTGHEKKKALNALGRFHAEAHHVDGEYRVYAKYIGEVGPGSTSPEPGPPLAEAPTLAQTVEPEGEHAHDCPNKEA